MAASQPILSRRRVIEVGLLVALSLAAVSSFKPLYDGWSVAVWVGLAALACTSVSLLLEGRRASLPVAIGIHAVVGTIVVAYIALGYTMPSGVPSGETFSEFAEQVTRGFGRTLDAILPVPRSSSTTTMMLAAFWISLASSIWLAYRSRHSILPVLPPLVVLVLAQPLIAPTEDNAVVSALAFALFALLLLVTRATPRIGRADDRSQNLPVLRSRLRPGIPLSILSVGLGGLIAAAVVVPMDNEPFDPREHRGNTASETFAVHPLDILKPHLQTDPPQTHLNVTYDDPEDALELEHLAMAVLDVYDGATWQSSAEFSAPDGKLTSGVPDDIASERFTYSVRLTEDVDPWVPTSPLPVEISTDDVLIADDSGTLIRSPFARFSDYMATSEVMRPSAEQLEAAEPDQSSDAVRYTQIPPDMPDTLTALSADLMSEGSPIERLENLDAAISAIPYDVNTTAGSSLARIEKFVFEDRRGYAEQHATTFALLARAQGFPTRLMVGYRLVTSEDGVGVPVERVTSAEYHVWPEVKFEGLGWVGFEPTPDPSLDESDLPQPTIAAPTEGNLIDQPSPEPPEAEQTDEAIDDSDGRRSRVAVTLLLALGAALLGLAVLLGVLLVKWLRRRRRLQTTDPRKRVLGVWAEVTDRLTETGVQLHPSMTVREVVGASGQLSAEVNDTLELMVTPVQRTMYGREPVDESVADRATEIEDRFRTETASVGPRWRRLWRRCDPRTL